mgnify:CR=1 FL=1
MTISNNNGITAIGDEGLGQQPWWVEQWMELINGYRFKKRLERAWGYAREGNVTSIRFEGRRVHARVQGTGEDPYKVKLWLDVLNDEDWGYVLEALTQKARWSAQLLAGIMPSDIERAFAASGKRLFPFKLQEVRSECSCPDKANPCKHISAVYFLMGDRFSEDPFVLFQLRGESITDLAEGVRDTPIVVPPRARVFVAAGLLGDAPTPEVGAVRKLLGDALVDLDSASGSLDHAHLEVFERTGHQQLMYSRAVWDAVTEWWSVSSSVERQP